MRYTFTTIIIIIKTEKMRILECFLSASSKNGRTETRELKSQNYPILVTLLLCLPVKPKTNTNCKSCIPGGIGGDGKGRALKSVIQGDTGGGRGSR